MHYEKNSLPLHVNGPINTCMCKCLIIVNIGLWKCNYTSLSTLNCLKCSFTYIRAVFIICSTSHISLGDLIWLESRMCSFGIINRWWAAFGAISEITYNTSFSYRIFSFVWSNLQNKQFFCILLSTILYFYSFFIFYKQYL